MLKNLVWMTVGGVFLLTMLTVMDAWRSGERLLGGIIDQVTAPQPEPEVDVRSVIVQQVRGASELTTSIFTMEAVVPTSRDKTLAGLLVGTTKLLYIARGEVRAGIDLSQLSTEDILVSDNSIQVRIPPPRIIDSKIDVRHSQVYDYDRGFLGLGPDVAPELQTLAEREALEKITLAACNENVLQDANDRAELTVKRLLSLSGYQNISVQTQPPTADACFPRMANQPLPTPTPLPQLPSAQPLPQAIPPVSPQATPQPLPSVPSPSQVPAPAPQATTSSSWSR